MSRKQPFVIYSPLEFFFYVRNAYRIALFSDWEAFRPSKGWFRLDDWKMRRWRDGRWEYREATEEEKREADTDALL